MSSSFISIETGENEGNSGINCIQLKDTKNTYKSQRKLIRQNSLTVRLLQIEKTASIFAEHKIFFFIGKTKCADIGNAFLLSAPRAVCCEQNFFSSVIFNNTRKLSVRNISVRKCRIKIHRSEEHTSELQSPDHLVCR